MSPYCKSLEAISRGNAIEVQGLIRKNQEYVAPHCAGIKRCANLRSSASTKLFPPSVCFALRRSAILLQLTRNACFHSSERLAGGSISATLPMVVTTSLESLPSRALSKRFVRMSPAARNPASRSAALVMSFHQLVPSDNST